MKATSVLLAATLLISSTAQARDYKHISEAIAAFASSQHSTTTGRAGSVEVGFSPDGSAQALIVQAIESAKSDIKVLAYSFTSPVVVKALLAAKRRGVSISIAADSSNVKSKSGTAALSTLATAGVEVRIVSDFKILHDKIMVWDGRHVQTGSFNYSKSANDANSENVIVLWDAPEIAAAYTRHWKSRWDRGARFAPTY